MITEIAQIDVKPGMESEFEAGVKNAAPIFKRAKGCHGMELRRSIEKPSRYRLFVAWETVEITMSASAARPISRNGENSSAIVSPRRPMLSTCSRSYTDFSAAILARGRTFPIGGVGPYWGHGEKP
jgi:hypothetical protein